MNSVTEGHPACSRQRTDRDFLVVEGELRGESEEGRRDGNGGLVSNTQGAPFAFSPASSGSSTRVNDAIADTATGEDDKDDKHIEINARGGGGGKEALRVAGGALTVVAGRRTSYEGSDPQTGEDHPTCRASTGDGGDVMSADDLRGACIRLGNNATGVGEGARGLKGACVENTSEQLWFCYRIVGPS